jgi:hypothetical protein
LIKWLINLFDLQAELLGNDVEVIWRLSSRPKGGLATGGGITNARERYGVALIDLKTGRISPVVAHLFLGEHKAPSIAISADGNFSITSKPGAADAQGLPTYTWQIRERRVGNVVGEMPSAISYTPFFVCRTVVVYLCPPVRRLVDGNWLEQPLTLRAFDLSRGSQIWARPMRDTAFRGPSPPTS